MKLTTPQGDRACGVLLGQGVGDALGVPYEFGTPPGAGEPAEMLGGGLINGAPGEWSDDTSMAVAVARAAVSRRDLASAEGLTAVAHEFLTWYASRPADIGIQTRGGAGRRRGPSGRPGGGAADARRRSRVRRPAHAVGRQRCADADLRGRTGLARRSGPDRAGRTGGRRAHPRRPVGR